MVVPIFIWKIFELNEAAADLCVEYEGDLNRIQLQSELKCFKIQAKITFKNISSRRNAYIGFTTKRAESSSSLSLYFLQNTTCLLK